MDVGNLITTFASKLFSLNFFQPIFPGDSGVDQLVEIIKVLLLSSNQFFTKSRSKVLGTPTREQIKEMNPNYTEFKFPQIKAHPWPKVSFGQF